MLEAGRNDDAKYAADHSRGRGDRAVALEAREARNGYIQIVADKGGAAMAKGGEEKDKKETGKRRQNAKDGDGGVM